VNDAPTPEQFSATRLFVALLVLIFCVEGAMMFVLDTPALGGVPPWARAIIDASVLTALASLFVWRLFMRPLRFALLSEAARARAVTESAAEGIVIIDERGLIEFFNRAAQRMFARQAEDVIGKNIRVLMPEPHASAHDGYIARYLRDGEARIMGRPREVVALRKDGAQFPIEINVTEIRLGGTRHFAGIVRDISARKQAEERIHRLAHYDSLTGAPNRALFYDRLSQAVRVAKRDGHELALLYLDLDGFKPINDSLGHEAGDAILKSVVERIRRVARESDTVARIGGDEFTVILPKIAAREDAGMVAEKIIDALSPGFYLGTQEQEVHIGASVGIAIFPGDAKDIDALVRTADASMYEAKRTGNTFRFSPA